jgi:hypothetical protein
MGNLADQRERRKLSSQNATMHHCPCFTCWIDAFQPGRLKNLDELFGKSEKKYNLHAEVGYIFCFVTQTYRNR